MSTEIVVNPILGTAVHAVGALFAACCYTPQKLVKRWSWQTYWLTQAAFCWFILPIAVAYLTIPHLADVLRAAPKDAMLRSFLLGTVYGIGGTAFGIAIRYIGFSLTYSLAIGISAVLGTLVPPLVRGELLRTFSKPGADWVIVAIVIGIAGIALCGVAGRSKETDLGGTKAHAGFSIAKGLPLSILAGIFSAVYGFALEAGEPIAAVAEQLGAGHYRGNVTYIFANSGAFATTALYCLYLHMKHRTLREMVELPAGVEKGNLPVNFIMAFFTGCLWFGQFFFYNLGHVRMGTFKFTSWAIHMIMLVLFSNAVGVVFMEWLGCKPRTKWLISAALAVLVAAVLVLTYGNYLGDLAAKAAKP